MSRTFWQVTDSNENLRRFFINQVRSSVILCALGNSCLVIGRRKDSAGEINKSELFALAFAMNRWNSKVCASWSVGGKNREWQVVSIISLPVLWSISGPLVKYDPISWTGAAFLGVSVSLSWNKWIPGEFIENSLSSSFALCFILGRSPSLPSLGRIHTGISKTAVNVRLFFPPLVKMVLTCQSIHI